MPYNTTAIPPRKEVTGQTQLPRESFTIHHPLAEALTLTNPR
jgi:hypothetical protein